MEVYDVFGQQPALGAFAGPSSRRGSVKEVPPLDLPGVAAKDAQRPSWEALPRQEGKPEPKEGPPASGGGLRQSLRSFRRAAVSYVLRKAA